MTSLNNLAASHGFSAVDENNLEAEKGFKNKFDN